MKNKLIPLTLMLLLVLVPFMILKGRYEDFIERNQAYYNGREYYYVSDNDKEIFEAFINEDSDKLQNLLGNEEPLTKYYIAAEKYTFNNFESIDSDKLEDYLKDCPIRTYLPDGGGFVKAFRVSKPFQIKAPYEDKLSMMYVDARDIIKTDNPNEKMIYVEYLCDAKAVNSIPKELKISDISGDGFAYKYLRSLPIKDEVRALAHQIRESLPIEEQDSLKSVSEAYINWITSNMYYIKDYKESMGIDNNLSDSSETLRLKAGVCQDFAWLLAEMFRSQDIPARLVYGVNPYKSGKIENDGKKYEGHVNVEVYDGSVWYMLNPTIYPDLGNNRLLYNVKGVDKIVLKGFDVDESGDLSFIPFFQNTPFDSDYESSYKFYRSDVDILMYTGK